MIHSFDYCVAHIGDVGAVREVREALVTVTGLAGAVAGEGVTFENGLHGMVVSLGKNYADVLVFSRQPVAIDCKVARTGSPLSVSVGEAILGRTVTAMGYVQSGEYDKSVKSEQRAVDTAPSGISARTKIRRMFTTGVAVVDLVVPIGAGQRELIIGDRTTGKTHFLLQAALTQARQGTVCIYVTIGKRQTEIKRIEEFLRHYFIFEQSVIVASSAYDSPGEIYIAPYTGMTIAEYFRDRGRDVLLIFDDLTTHAKYYREFALLLGSFPGRESYPGDIFHLHARLLERAGCFIKMQNEKDKSQKSDVTITCLPAVESVGGDMTGYIQTNVMSMTDGHIFFDEALMTGGVRPAINVFLSVTRVGRQTQSALFREIGSFILSALKSYDDAQRYLRFGPELTETVQETLRRGMALTKLFSQTSFTPYPVELLAVLVSLLWSDSWDGEGAEVIAKRYMNNKEMRETISEVIKSCETMKELQVKVKRQMVIPSSKVSKAATK